MDARSIAGGFEHVVACINESGLHSALEGLGNAVDEWTTGPSKGRLKKVQTELAGAIAAMRSIRASEPSVSDLARRTYRQLYIGVADDATELELRRPVVELATPQAVQQGLHGVINKIRPRLAFLDTASLTMRALVPEREPLTEGQSDATLYFPAGAGIGRLSQVVKRFREVEVIVRAAAETRGQPYHDLVVPEIRSGSLELVLAATNTVIAGVGLLWARVFGLSKWLLELQNTQAKVRELNLETTKEIIEMMGNDAKTDRMKREIVAEFLSLAKSRTKMADNERDVLFSRAVDTVLSMQLAGARLMLPADVEHEHGLDLISIHEQLEQLGAGTEPFALLTEDATPSDDASANDEQAGTEIVHGTDDPVSEEAQDDEPDPDPEVGG